MGFGDQLARKIFRFNTGSQVNIGLTSPYVMAVADNQLKICDPDDITKCVRFDAGGVTTATTRVVTLADSDYPFAGAAGAISPGEQYVYQSAAFVLGNVNTAQAMFTAAHDTFTGVAATTYRFELVARLTTGATSHTTAFGLLGAGAATFTSVNLVGICSSGADATLAASQQASIVVSTAQVVTAASTAVKTNLFITGSFQVLAGGTIIPSVTFSADPTGTCQTDVGSYCRVYPIGTNALAGTTGWS